MTLDEELAAFYRKCGFGDVAGKRPLTVRVYTGCLLVPMPNIETRRRYLKYHDLHHLITGYSVGLATNLAADGQPVMFSGGRLAADLTLPKLRHRWQSPAICHQAMWCCCVYRRQQAVRTAALSALLLPGDGGR